MKRFLAAAVSLLMTFALATVSTVAGPVSTASAAPPGGGTVYGATGTGQILNVDVNAVGLNLANIGLASSNATTSSASSTPNNRSSAQSANLAATVVGLTLPINVRGQTALPDNPTALTTGVPTADINLPPLQVDLGVLNSTNQARWAGDTSCVEGGLLSDSQTTTANASVGISALVTNLNVLTLGAANVRNTNSLVNTATNAGLNKAVESKAVGVVTDLKLLNDTVVVTVTGNPTLTATATGIAGTASVTSNASAVVVQVKIGADPAVTLSLGVPVNIAGLGSIVLNAPVLATPAADGTTASGSWNFLTVDASVLGLTGASVDLLQMTASATAPSGGLDCPAAIPSAPVIVVPSENATVTTATPTISGTAEPNATVNVTIDGAAPITTTADGAGNWTITSPVLANGAHTATATQTVAGATSPATPTRNFTVAVAAPAAPVITAPADNTVSNNRTPVITGTGVVGNTITVFDGATSLGTTTVITGGTWTLTSPQLSEGLHTFTATQQAATGPASAASNAVRYTVDITAPAILTIALPAQNSTVTDPTPEISGSGAEDGATVIVREGATEICRVTVTTGPGWACTPATALAEGSHTITATQTDAAGNVGPVSADRTFNVDSLDPAAVTIVTPAQNATVRDDTPTITGGGAEAGATVIVTEGGTELCRVTAVTAGTWSCTPTTPLDQGSHTIVATQTDAAGNVGPASDPRTFVVDSVAPVAVTITTPAQNAVVTDDTPTITGGGAEAGATVIVTEGGTELCRVTVVTAGTWSCTPTIPLDQGSHTIVATQTDAAGNVGPASLPRTFSIDSINPLAVVIQTPVDGSFLTNARPIISGTGAEAGATVIVKEGATEVCRVTVVLAGAWACTPSADLAEGEHTIVATQTDLAGNVSPNSNTVTFTVDTVNPNRPIISTPAANAQVTGANVPVTGTGEAGSTISVTVTNGITTFGPLTALIDVNGRWSVTFSGLAPAQYVAAAFQTDRAGNRSPLPDPTRPFEVVSDVRDAPVIAAPTTSTVAVSNNRPVIRGTGVAGAVLTVRDLADSGKILGTTTVGSNGAWTLNLSADLADGPHQFRATQAGTNGVPSSPSNVVDYVVDTTAAAPRITAPANDSSKPQNTRTPRITGNGAEPGATIVVRDGGKVICTTTATASGTWTCTPPELAEGSHTITATQTDKAGNTSPASAPVTFVIEIRLAITSPPRLNRTKDNTPSVGGTSDEVGAQVTVSKRGTVWCRTTVRSNKTWSCSSPNKQPDGFHLVSASARSIGGFTKNAAAPILIVIDTLRPGAPRITSPSPNAQVPVGAVNVRGTGAPGGTITLWDEKGVARGVVFVSLNGTWTISVKGLTSGPHSFTATQIDGAKNLSAASGRTVITLAGTNGVAGVRTPVIDPTLDKASKSTTSLRISGVGQRGATIVITDERGVRSATVPVSSSGNWALTFPSSPQGIHRYTATQTYKVGARTTTVKSQVVQLRLDTTKPATPTLEAPLPGDVQATTLPAFGGSSEPGTVVEATIDGKVIQPKGGLKGALSDNDRRWILLSTVAVGAGTHTLRLVAVDPAGNRSGILTTSIRTK
ncbi:MAG: Ig-like domain-containing protein [Nakamurella sp.]